MDHIQPLSLWEVTAAEPFVQGDPLPQRSDLVIIGGGITGLSTALHGVQKGLSCHVIEAGQIGFGGSGRNVGLVNAGLWLPPEEVEKRLGLQRAQGLLGDLPGLVFNLIKTHKIACEARRVGTLHAAHAPSGLRELERRAAQWERLGAPVTLLDAGQMAAKTGSEAFSGGLFDRRAGTLNPMGYVRGLARAARGAGARVTSNCRALALRQKAGGWIVQTEQGTLQASKVVIATNAYSERLWSDLRRSYVPIEFFQLATPPLGERADAILQEGQGLWDTAPVMSSLRKDNEGRLIIGSMGDGRTALARRWAMRRLRRLFPQLGQVEVTHAWQGRIAMTPDHLFRVHELDEGLYCPIGYNGRGITTGTLIGKALAEYLTGADAGCLPVPVTPLKAVPMRWLKAHLYHAAFTANQFFR